ncbi:Choline transporter-like protein 2 [Schistosoma japonicum]|nr:Choline transporter-like protein 2 [Schistosoma japonicum]
MGFCVGHKHAENVKTLTTVPVQNRTCTDIPCCVVFLIFVIGFLAVTLWSFAMGDYALLLYPTDSHGRVCGRDVHDKPYLLFFDLIVCVKLGPSVVVTGCPTPQVCLSSCPNYSWSPDASNGDATRDSMICLDGVNANDPKFSGQSVQQLVRNGQCAPNVYPSKPVLNRCLPNQSFELTAIVTGQAHNNADKSMLLQNPDDPMVNGVKVSQDTFLFKLVTIWEKIVADLTQTWHIIVICILVSVVLSFIWIYLLRCCTAAIVWTTITLYVTLFTIGTVFCFLRWHKLSTTSESATYFESYSVMASYFRWAPTWLGLGIIFAILLGITLLILIFLRQRIHIAIAILKEVSKAVSSNPSVPLLPILPFFLEMIVIVLVLLVAFSLSTISDPVGAKVINGSDPVMNLSLEDKAKKGIQDIIRLIPCNPLIYHLPTNVQFIHVLLMALAGVFAEYYFTRFDRKPQLRCSSIRSLFRSIFYHSGSLAFGSFLIALLQWLRSVLEYLHIKLKKANNPIAAFFLKCFSCCFWLLEKCLRFINRNAFIMIAIYGQNFCSASGSALSLLSRNLVRLVVVDKVTDFILFIGKLVIVGSVGGMAYIYLEGILIGLRPNLHYTFAPLCIIILCSYLVASLFSNVFETGVETTFLCFLEDLERNDGSAEKPYFMSTNLLQILGKYNRKPNGSHDKN